MKSRQEINKKSNRKYNKKGGMLRRLIGRTRRRTRPQQQVLPNVQHNLRNENRREIEMLRRRRRTRPQRQQRVSPRVQYNSNNENRREREMGGPYTISEIQSHMDAYRMAGISDDYENQGINTVQTQRRKKKHLHNFIKNDLGRYNDNPDDSCAICIEEFDNKKEVVKLNPCNHFFHKECITGWVKTTRNPNCPTCRTEIEGFRNIKLKKKSKRRKSHSVNSKKGKTKRKRRKTL